MVKRTLKKPEPEVMHNLVAVKGDLLTARCGVTAKKPKVGLGNMASFGFNCPDCEARTAQMKADYAT